MNILLIARHCGEPGSGGSRRPLLLARYLDKLGHKTTVVTPYPCPNLPHVIEIPLETDEIGAEIKAQARPSLAVGKLIKSLPRRILSKDTMLALRRWKYFPDMDIRWAESVWDHLQKQPLNYDWVITTSPSESLHTIGRRLADHCNARWCLELRDSWIATSHRDYLKGSRGFAEIILAKRCLRRADAAVTVNPAIAQEIRNLGRPGLPVDVIGHFSEPFTKASLELDSTKFNLVHAGAFELSDRNRSLSCLVEHLVAISNHRDRNNLIPLRLHIAGRLNGKELDLCKTVAGIEIVNHGSLTLDDCRALQAGADGLLLYSPKGSTALPGKYAEYAVSGKPILFSGPEIIRSMVSAPHLLKSIETLEHLEPGLSAGKDPNVIASKQVQAFVTFLQDL